MSSSKGKRAKIQSSDEDLEIEISPIPSSTSKFTNHHIENLGLRYKNVSSPTEFFNGMINYAQVDNHELFFPELKDYGDFTNLKEEIIIERYSSYYSFLSSLAEICQPSVITNERESQTDTFIANLFIQMGFNQCPFRVKYKPFIEGIINEKTVTSIADHAI